MGDVNNRNQNNAHPGQLPPRSGKDQTKPVFPSVRQPLVHRPRLSRSFGDNSAPIIIVAAPAGYGKSTLVYQWLGESRLPSAWISLNHLDNDSVGFFIRLTDALRTINETQIEATCRALYDKNPPPIPVLMRTLIGDLGMATEPFILVLDDYHLIENQEIHEAMATLLNSIPRAMRLVLISRVWPSLPLARFESRGKLMRVSQDDLRFNDEESHQLMRLSDELDIDREDADTINLHAEGWVTGLRLVGYMLRGQSPEAIHVFADEFSGNVQTIDSYLWEEVIDSQPSDIRSFLLDISILDRFCAPLCSAITGNPESAAIIHQLERDRLFVVGLDDQWTWLRFHHLFSAALTKRLTAEKSPGSISELHRRAAQWFEEHGLIQEASRHAIAGQDWERAIRVLSSIGIDRPSMTSFETLCSWLLDIPHEILVQHPHLAFRYAWALTWLGQFKLADQMIALVDEAWASSVPDNVVAHLSTLKALRNLYTRPSLCAAHAENALRNLGGDQVVERGMAYCLVGLGSMYCGDLSTAEYAFDQLRALMDGARSGVSHLTEIAGSAFVILRRGRLNDASHLLEEALASADESDGVGNQIAPWVLAEIRFEQLDLRAADRLLQIAATVQEQNRTPIFLPVILKTLAEIAWTRGLVDLAFENVDRAIQVAEMTPAPRHRNHTLALQARFWIDAGQLSLAERWADSCELDLNSPLISDWQYEYVTLARWFIANNELAAALSLTDALIDLTNQQGQYGNLVELLLLRATILSKQGDIAAAVGDLDRSLEIGDRSGFLRTFVCDLSLMQTLLNHPSLQKRHGPYLRRIEKAASQMKRPTTSVPPPQPVQELSNRETGVLKLVAEGLSNREIGDRLFISDKTVKRHLSSIYGKLQVANRVQALERARHTGVL